MRLWRRWKNWTRKRAWDLAEMDRVMYGTGFVVERWWGFKRINPFKMFLTSQSPKVGDQK